MGLNSAGLDAFFTCAQEKNFTRAATRLFITQSALSQRIKNLESEVGATLFIRERIGVRLTEQGDSLLRYCYTREQMEQELVQAMSGSRELAGTLKIGAYSTVMRSLVLPVLKEISKKHSQVQISIVSKELQELPELLRNSSVQFILLDQKIEKEGIQSLKLGMEHNVRIRKKGTEFTGYFLDNDHEDETSLRFLKLKSGAKIKRHFLDEVYGIIDGVLLGLGDAVIPCHLIQDLKGIEVIEGGATLSNPVYLHYYEQVIQPRLATVFIGAIQSRATDFLGS